MVEEEAAMEDLDFFVFVGMVPHHGEAFAVVIREMSILQRSHRILCFPVILFIVVVILGAPRS
jgi:hypothetical protein